MGGELRPFRLRTPLLSAGRTHTILAETDRMTVAIKGYAQGGENALHAHPDEDHVFVILQGEATYHDADGQMLVLGRHEGVLVPHGVLYRFESTGDEQLVLLRTGAGPREQTYHRVGPDGEVIPARSAANGYEEPVPIPGQFFE